MSSGWNIGMVVYIIIGSFMFFNIFQVIRYKKTLNELPPKERENTQAVHYFAEQISYNVFYILVLFVLMISYYRLNQLNDYYKKNFADLNITNIGVKSELHRF